MFGTLNIRTTVYAVIASLLVACIFVSWPLSANAASKNGGGTTNVQSNSTKRSTANSLSTAGTAGATKGAAGGGGKGGGGGGTRPLDPIRGESKDGGHPY
jgi:hypothetical protein